MLILILILIVDEYDHVFRNLLSEGYSTDIVKRNLRRRKVQKEDRERKEEKVSERGVKLKGNQASRGGDTESKVDWVKIT